MKTVNKIWLRLFLSIACIFVVFVLLVIAAGSTLFEGFYTASVRRGMRSCAEKIAGIDLQDRSAALKVLRSAETEYNVSVTVYKDSRPVYSTLRHEGGNRPDMDGFDLLIDRQDNGLSVIETRPDGERGVFSRVTDGVDEMLVYEYSGDDGTAVSLRMEKTLIENSAAAAGRFMMIIAVVCLAGALVWSVFFARRFTRPIEEMTSVARDMSELDFSRRVDAGRSDELGMLADSLNQLGASLDGALSELNERNRRLQSEIDAERRLDEMRKGFVASVSHELKTPISIIQGYAEGLNGGMAESEEDRKKYCGVILSESKRMHDLVISLLELSRYESGVGTNSGTFDLSSSVVNIADAFSSLMEKKQVTLELSVPESMTVTGDRTLFEHVIENYLSNAVSHVNVGGKVRIFTEPYGDSARICVYNSGSSVAPEDMDKVWQSFWRADKSHNRAEGRFGLGLSIVKAIMTGASLDFGVFNTDDGVVFWSQVPFAKCPEGHCASI